MKNDVIVIVPIYKDFMTDFEDISFKRMLEIFNSRKICIIAPRSISKFVMELSKENNNVIVSFFSDEYFKSIIGYNRLLMNYEFYYSFKKYKFMLISQLDVYVIKDEIDYWIDKGYDNVGAPIFEGYAKPSKKIKEMGSNGGFCLRKIESCLNVLSNIEYRYSTLSSLLKMESIWYWKLYRVIRDGLIFNYKLKYFKPIINEDMFWSIIVPLQFPFFKTCKPSKAMYFSYDANPKMLFEMCNFSYPMAIHAWWRYNKVFVTEVIEKLNKN